MKSVKLLFLLLFLISSRTALCQKDLWGSSPKAITDNLKSIGKELVYQGSDEKLVYLEYKMVPGLSCVFMFENEQLVSVIRRYDTSVSIPDVPKGYRKPNSLKPTWVDNENELIIQRSYRPGFIEDIVMPLNK